MYLRRLYNDQGQVNGMRVLRASKRWHVSPTLLEEGVMQGWLDMGRGKVTLHGEKEPLVYTIERPPGHYCCHCNAIVHDGPGGQAHVKAMHDGVESPDRNNPAGYRRDNFYSLALENGGGSEEEDVEEETETEEVSVYADDEEPGPSQTVTPRAQA